ncbi:MAG TPA: SDR family oxidoreductase [Burkholderiales bacterium]|nr:SDR family oxidoreductase [Burkholderiales bacterium]
MKSILITGASGFVGRALCDLLDSQGYVVRRASRKDQPAQPFSTIAVGDIGPQTDWKAALEGCESVVHLAAHVHVAGKSADDEGMFHRINAEGSEELARQAARSGVRRFVFLSSVKVNGERSPSRPFTESDPPMPGDAYGASKAEAEKRIMSIGAQTGMEVVVVRPPLVYGEGVKANFLNLLRIVDAGLPLPFRSMDNRRSLVYVGNLASALEACLTHPAAANRVFFVSDDCDVSTPQLVREIAGALGKKARLIPFPMGLLAAIAAATGSADQVARLTDSLQVNIGAIKTALDWRPRISLQEGLKRTGSWYRHSHPR